MPNYFSLLLAFLFFASNAYSQKSSSWNKEQKNALYKECTDDLKRGGVSNTQKQEEFCYCYLQKIITEFTSAEVANLIELEQKKVSEKKYKSCSAETGVRFDYSLSSNSYSANSWSGDQRNYHYKKCKKDVFAKNYKITLEEQEEFCQCYLKKLSKNHTSAEVDNMITPELNKLQSKYFNACSSETGLSLSTNNIATTVLEVFTGDWDRKKKDKYYSDCEQDIKNDSQNHSETDVEEFCICYIDRLTRKYSARELDDMIDAEFKRAKQGLYNKCTSRTTIGIMNQEQNMLGRWERHSGEVLIFKENGLLKYIFEENDMEEDWRWKYKPGNILVFVAGGVEIEYKVLQVKEDYIKYKPMKHSNQIYEYYKK